MDESTTIDSKPEVMNIDDIPERENPHNKSNKVDTLLCPDHPLLEKFQASLRQHLLRAKEQLTTEIEEFNFKIRTKSKEREEYGVRLYDLQQEILRQNEILEGYTQEMVEISEKRKQNEAVMYPMKKDFDDQTAILKEAKQRHNKRLVELGNLQNLESNIEKWAQEIEDEVQAAKRTVSKDSKLQQSLAEEKKKTDFLLFNLDMEVRERERELDLIISQIKEQTGHIDVLNTSLSDANADLEVIQQEHKRLTQAWGEVIIAIQHRDKILYQSKDDLGKSEEDYKLTCASIIATKKQAQKEMEQSEKLEAFKHRLEEDLKSLKKQTDKEAEILAKLEMKMEQLPLLIEQTEKDFVEARKEGNALELSLRSLQVKIDRQAMKKLDIENAILKLAQDQLMADKASQYRMKMLHESQEQRRMMELNLAQSESSLATTLLDLERMKGVVIKIREDHDEISQKYSNVNREADELTEELKMLEYQINMKMKQIDLLSKKLDTLIQAEGVEISPTELKIKNAEISITNVEQQIKDAQQFWLILQGHFVSITEKRNIQLSDVQIARKELMIINQKSLKIDTDLEEIETAGAEINRDIQKLSTKLDLLGGKLFEEKKMHETGEIECQMRHFELLDQLREKEMAILATEQEILNLTKDLDAYKDQVLQHHRAALTWETKYKLTEETIRWRRGESAIESEIGHMKAEIHRMEIRHSQLKRAQEKLIQDLEHSVMHREQIFVAAVTRHKRDGCQSRTRTSVQQKLHDVRNRLKLSQTEMNMAEVNLGNLVCQRDEWLEEIARKDEEIANERQQDALLQAEIEQALLLKYQNLDNIVRKQNRAKSYRRLVGANVHPKMSKTEASIELNLQKQKDVNANLCSVVEQLMAEFPDKKFPLSRILQTLVED